jgi:transposase InsO family protein
MTSRRSSTASDCAPPVQARARAQGSQFTSTAFTGLLTDNAIAISMDGRGAWRDNVFVERLWRSVKYEEVYLKAYDTVAEARTSIGCYFSFYNAVSYYPTRLCH